MLSSRPGRGESKDSLLIGLPKMTRKRKRQRLPILPNTAFVFVASAILVVFGTALVLYYVGNSQKSDSSRPMANVLSPHAAVAGRLNSLSIPDAHTPRLHNLRKAKRNHPVNRVNVVPGSVNSISNGTIHPDVHEQAVHEQIIPPLQHLSKEAVEMCTRTLWHTLETTTIVLPNKETFIHTGDIDDLWLRDSAAQIHPLLLPIQTSQDPTDPVVKRAFIYNDPKLERIVSGLIARHAFYIRHDPYANAFRIDDTYNFPEEGKRLGRHDYISTWNYELDSACYTIRMMYNYWKQSRQPQPTLVDNPAVKDAVEMMIYLWIAEQEHELDKYPVGRLFDCKNCNKPYRYPELTHGGKGSPTNATAGLTWTGFRPSDDATQYGYLIPANMFAVVVLGYVQELCRELWHDEKLSKKAMKLQSDIQRGIHEHGIVTHPKYGKIYAYEVDGFGNYLLMDDANVPSLLSIPYLEYPFDKEIYANTRSFILSKDNPTYAEGYNTATGHVAGISSPHMKGRISHNVWPMSLAMQALTTNDVSEAHHLVEQLVKGSAKTGWMHESFDVNNPASYTRAWFCWADSLYAELVMRLLNATNDQSGLACPDPGYKYKVLEWKDTDALEKSNINK